MEPGGGSAGLPESSAPSVRLPVKEQRDSFVYG